MFLIKKDVKNFWIITIIFLTIIITTIALITQLTIVSSNNTILNDNISNPNHLWLPTGSWANIWHSLSTFTLQTNIFVLFFFILILINYLKKRKSKWINSYLQLAVTIYISITVIIFWLALFKPMLYTINFQKTSHIIKFINTFLLHLITPLLTIIFFLLTSGNKKWKIAPTSIKALPLAISYMFIYLTYILIKGTFVGQINHTKTNIFIDYSYPYFFLNIKSNLNYFFLYLFFILILFILLFAIYYIYNNWKYQKNYGEKIKNKKELLKAILF